MSEPYTPTTAEVRSGYADGGGEYRDIAEGWFDRWLSKVKAVAWDAGAQAQAAAYGMDKDTGPNPYPAGDGR